jgi:hypothetical protein
MSSTLLGHLFLNENPDIHARPLQKRRLSERYMDEPAL